MTLTLSARSAIISSVPDTGHLTNSVIFSTETLLRFFLLMCFNYCNSIFGDMLKCRMCQIRSLLNGMIRLPPWGSSSVSDYMWDSLHWFPVEERIKFKILLLWWTLLVDTALTYTLHSAAIYSSFKQTGTAIVVLPPTVELCRCRASEHQLTPIVPTPI